MDPPISESLVSSGHSSRVVPRPRDSSTRSATCSSSNTSRDLVTRSLNWGQVQVRILSYSHGLLGRLEHVIAVEAHPQPLSTLRGLLEANNVRNVHVAELAIHSERGTVTMGTVDDWQANSTVKLDGETILVDAITLDDLVSRYGLSRIDFLKVNIEGAEKPALAGAASNALTMTRHVAVSCHDFIASSPSDPLRTEEWVRATLDAAGFMLLPQRALTSAPGSGTTSTAHAKHLSGDSGLLKVAVCVDTLDVLGGTERQVVRLIRALRAHETEVALLSRWPLRSDNPYVAEVRALGVTVRARAWFGPGTTWWSRRRLLRQRVGRRLHHAYDGSDAWRWQIQQLRRMYSRRTSAWSCTKSQCSVTLPLPPSSALQTPQARRPDGLRAYPGLEATPVAPWATLTADGEEACRRASPTAGSSMGPEPAEVPARRRKDGPSCRCYAGRLTPQKGVDVLIEALTGLPNVELVCAGSGPEAQNLKTRAKRAAVPAAFPGFLSESEVLAVLPRRCGRAPLPQRRGHAVLHRRSTGSRDPDRGLRVGGLERTLRQVTPWGARLVEPDEATALRTAVTAMLEADPSRVTPELRSHYEKTFSPRACSGCTWTPTATRKRHWLRSFSRCQVWQGPVRARAPSSKCSHTCQGRCQCKQLLAQRSEAFRPHSLKGPSDRAADRASPSASTLPGWTSRPGGGTSWANTRRIPRHRSR